MRRWCVLLALLLPLAEAGSPDDPEIEDPTGDSLDDIKDILKVWIDEGIVLDSEGRPSLVVGVQIAVDDPDLSSLFALHERIRIAFKGDYAGAPGGHEFYVSAQPAIGTTTETGEDRFICNFGIASAAGGSADVSAELGMDEGTWDGTTFHCILPLEFIGGEAAYGQTLTDLWAVYQIVQRGPTNSADEAGVNTHDLDRAPDSGFGRDYVIFQPPASAPDVAYGVIESLPFDNETDAPTTGVFQYNLSSSEPLRFLGQVEAGNLTVNVTHNQTHIFAWNGTEGFDHSMVEVPTCLDAAQPCQYTIVYTMSDFVGMVGIEVAQNRTMSEAPATEPAGNATGNETEQQGPDSQESPGLALPLVAVAVAAALMRRR